MDSHITTTITEEIIQHHNNVVSNLKRSVSEAIEAGRGINRMQQLLKPRGEFLGWISDELPFSERTTYNYLNLYRYKEDVATVANLADAYRLIDNIEAQKKGQVAQRIEEAERTGVKPETWNDDTEKAYRRKVNRERIEQESEKIFEDEAEGFSDDPMHKLFDRIMEETTQEADLDLSNLQNDVRQKGIFRVLEEYIEGSGTISERLEAVHNLIKKLRLIAITYQQESLND